MPPRTARGRLGGLLLVSACSSSPQEPSPASARDSASLPRATAPEPSQVSAPPSPSGAIAPTAVPPGASGRPARPLPPLDGPPFVALEVPGFDAAVVAVPLGATAPAPLLIATHGNYDTPEWQCQTWREIVGPSVFVLCPRGIARPDSPSQADVRFTYATNAQLEKELEAALAALRSRFGGHLAERAITYVGFSLGAIMGVAIAARAAHEGRYEAMVLVEGGHDRWTPGTAKAFATAGGRRVMFACGQASCFLDAKRASAHLERAGVATKIVGVKDAGHTYGGAVADAVRGAWSFLEAPRPAAGPSAGSTAGPPQ